MSRHDGELLLRDYFCGAGGSTQGFAKVPGVRPIHAANHWDLAIDSHAANFPDVEHSKEDVRKISPDALPYAELFWPLTAPLPTQTTIQGDALVHGGSLPGVEDCLFRMLEPREIGAGMAFASTYVVLGNKRDQVAQYGNAVTPPVSEVLGCALVECITGEPIERAA